MIPFELTILGAGSALPTIHRSATSQFYTTMDTIC